MKYEPLPTRPVRPYSGLRLVAGALPGLLALLLIVAILYGSEAIVQELTTALLY